ncbi:MAG: triosephosphate isomerase [Candidatus Yanofskybacteria bacterium]|nr:triosephosphate isomerase [Candidatus Yanofskybacteria bacterium]
MKKKLIVSNWKMQPTTLAEAEQILDLVDEYLGSLSERELNLVFCPPFVFTEEVGKILKTSHLLHQSGLGAQDISTDDRMALTGEVSGPMLKKLGARYVIVGHSERRWKLGESDEVVNKKLKAVLRNEMMPIVAVGEKTRDDNFEDFLKEQVLNTFAGLSAEEVARCIIAYEPVWAISTTPGARPDTPESALESVEVIKETLATALQSTALPRYLYGGSITSVNAREFLSNDGFDGVLIGGASTNKEEFVKILAIASKL